MVIGFCGGTGSGKSTLVEYATDLLGKKNTLVIAQDHYYKHLPELSFKERCKINFDHPDSLDLNLLTQHITKLKKGKNITRPVYSFKEHLRLNETVNYSPNKYILVEGILVFTSKPLCDLFDYKVYIETNKENRVKRRIARDTLTRGRTINEVKERFENTLHKMHSLFIEPKKNIADIIIINNRLNQAKSDMQRFIKNIK